MKLFPQSRSGTLRLAFVMLLLVVIGICYRPDRIISYLLSSKQEGDILFQSLPKGPLVDTIEGVTNSEWSHCGILLKADGQWVVAEAIGHVRYTPLYQWMLRGRRYKIASYRLKRPPEGLHERITEGVEGLWGKFYDFDYAPEDNEIYCSELVYKVFDRTLRIKIGEWERLGDLNWQPFEGFIRETQDGSLPLDRPMITPVGLTRSPLVKKIF